MKQKALCIWSALALLAFASACAQKNPTSPTTTQSAPVAAQQQTETPATITKNGVTLTSPVAVSPADGQQFKFADQPIKLVVSNAVTTGTSAATYTFEVATDSGFSNITFSKSGVAAGANQTSLSIDKQAGQNTYYWRARATVGGVQSLNSKARSFSIGPEVVLQTPAPISPAQNSTVNGTAVLVTADVGRSGPVTAVTYKFDVSDSSTFANVVFTKTVGEQPGQTSASVDAQLTNNATYYWRVQASDNASGVTSAVSPVFSFRYLAFDMHQATIYNSPTDLANWPETAHITSVVFTSDAFLVDFDKRDGPDRWPDTPFGDGSLEYTLGMCLNVGGHWDCSAVVQFWFGRELSASGAPWNIGGAWFYDPARWGPLTGQQPQDGDTVGLFVCAGNCRNNTAGDNSYVKERSNVVLVPWTNEGGDVTYTFSKGRVIRH
jgi:hypothetical protein